MSEGADRERRAGRGRLSSIDLLPDEAQEDVSWARVELNKRERTAADILHEFNGRLVDKGIEPVSKSAFNRTSVKIAAMSAKINEARQIFAGAAPQFTAESVDEHTVVLGEFIKLLIFDIVQADGADVGTLGAMRLAQAHLAVIRSQKISAERRQKLQAEFSKQATEAVDKVAKAAGLTGDTVGRIRAEILGIRTEQPASGAPRAESAP